MHPDVVVASGDCFIGLLAWWVARACGARFVFDVYDDYRRFGGYRLFLGTDAYGFLLRRADLVLYASRVLAQAHTGSAPWHLAPNGVDPEQFRALDTGESRRRTGMAESGTRWVGYFGGMDEERGADDLIDAVGRLHARDKAVRLVLCGHPRPGLAYREPWVDFRGPVEHARMPDFINACDVVALPYRRGPIIDMASSCKIAEYLFCRRPMVATRTPNMLGNFASQAAELGEAICSPGDAEDLARAIDYQLSHGVIATPPQDHTWRTIAAQALAALESSGRVR
jgi:glycosyltransferase involved in cell wall biosynthesis